MKNLQEDPTDKQTALVYGDYLILRRAKERNREDRSKLKTTPISGRARTGRSPGASEKVRTPKYGPRGRTRKAAEKAKEAISRGRREEEEESPSPLRSPRGRRQKTKKIELDEEAKRHLQAGRSRQEQYQQSGGRHTVGEVLVVVAPETPIPTEKGSVCPAPPPPKQEYRYTAVVSGEAKQQRVPVKMPLSTMVSLGHVKPKPSAAASKPSDLEETKVTEEMDMEILPAVTQGGLPPA